MPLEQAIALRFRYLSDFVDELSANISIGGMFIRSDRPHPVGSIFEFELELDDAQQPLVAGKAQVAWIRRRAIDGQQPAGMGVRFVELDDDSRRAIQRMVAGQLGSGGRPFELEPAAGPEPQAAAPPESARPPGAPSALPAAADSAPTETLPEPSFAATPARRAASPPPVAVAGAAAARSLRRYPRPRFWMLLSALLALALVVILWWRPAERRSPAQEQTGAPAPATEPAAPAPAAAVPPRPDAGRPAAPGAGAPASPAAAVDSGELEAVRDWARAWSEQRVEDYLAAYAASFEPAGGLSRGAWERQRRARLAAPAWIEVGLAFVESEQIGADRRRVRFVQAYESDSYRDVVRKQLELAREGGRWRIVSERVEP